MYFLFSFVTQWFYFLSLHLSLLPTFHMDSGPYPLTDFTVFRQQGLGNSRRGGKAGLEIKTSGS